MTNFSRSFLLIFALLALTFTAGASPIVYLTFNNGGSYSDGSSSVGLYNLSISSTGFNDPSAGILNSPCLSFNLHVTGGEQWTATESRIVDFSNPTVVADLKQIVYLDIVGLTYANTDATVSPIQHAIWDLGESISGQTLSFTDSATNAWLTQAATNYGTISNTTYQSYNVLIPTGANILDIGKTGTEAQFFLDHTSGYTPPVPEPATMLMLGTGLIGLGLVGRKRLAARK